MQVTLELKRFFCSCFFVVVLLPAFVFPLCEHLVDLRLLRDATIKSSYICWFFEPKCKQGNIQWINERTRQDSLDLTELNPIPVLRCHKNYIFTVITIYLQEELLMVYRYSEAGLKTDVLASLPTNRWIDSSCRNCSRSSSRKIIFVWYRSANMPIKFCRCAQFAPFFMR